MNPRTDGRSQRQTRAIMHAQQRRARELAPLHAEIATAIEQLGWKRARPIVIAVMGHATGGRNGTWWRKVGKGNGARLLTLLCREPVQGVLFDHPATPRRSGTKPNARAPPHADADAMPLNKTVRTRRGTMSKAQTVSEPAEIERFIAGATSQVLDDPEAVSRAIVHDILTAPSIDEVFRRRELTHARDVLAERLTIIGVRWMQGDYDTDEPGFYAVIDAANDDGEKLQVSCGARNVMAQLWRLHELDAFPIQVAIVESGRTTAAGYKPMTLEPRNAA